MGGRIRGNVCYIQHVVSMPSILPLRMHANSVIQRLQNVNSPSYWTDKEAALISILSDLFLL